MPILLCIRVRPHCHVQVLLCMFQFSEHFTEQSVGGDALVCLSMCRGWVAHDSFWRKTQQICSHLFGYGRSISAGFPSRGNAHARCLSLDKSFNCLTFALSALLAALQPPVRSGCTQKIESCIAPLAPGPAHFTIPPVFCLRGARHELCLRRVEAMKEQEQKKNLDVVVT